MADFPAMPLWTDAYLADTHPELTLEEHGCYMLLIMAAWRRPDCALPNDNSWFCRWLGIHGNRWNRLRQRILERFFTLNEGGSWEQKRLSKERDFVRKTAGKRSETARKRWAKLRENKGMDNTDAYAPTPTPIESSLLLDSSLRSESKIRSDSKKADSYESAKESGAGAPAADAAPPRSRNGTRLPDEFPLTPELIRFANQEGYDDEAAIRLFASFCDYWHAKAGPAGRKLDWIATWRNWVRNQRAHPAPNGGYRSIAPFGGPFGHGASGQTSRLTEAAAVLHARQQRANGHF